jgi:hypothetical protein
VHIFPQNASFYTYQNTIQKGGLVQQYFLMQQNMFFAICG